MVLLQSHSTTIRSSFPSCRSQRRSRPQCIALTSVPLSVVPACVLYGSGILIGTGPQYSIRLDFAIDRSTAPQEPHSCQAGVGTSVLHRQRLYYRVFLSVESVPVTLQVWNPLIERSTTAWIRSIAPYLSSGAYTSPSSCRRSCFQTSLSLMLHHWTTPDLSILAPLLLLSLSFLVFILAQQPTPATIRDSLEEASSQQFGSRPQQSSRAAILAKKEAWHRTQQQ